jgi:hypothetical protein
MAYAECASGALQKTKISLTHYMANQIAPTFDYNSTRNKLLLTEYGRNVQNMVKYICELPTKEERNRYANVVIELMGFLNPHLRDVADFKHKLWDHLHMISNFQIDVDSPYPKPSEEAIHFKPAPLKYPNQRIRFKHYGKTVELMIAKARSIEEPARRQHMVQAFMKMAYVQWNKDSVADESILADLRELSQGELKLEENVNLTKVEYRAAPSAQLNRGRNNNNNQNNRGGGGGGTRTNNNNNPRNNNNQNNRGRNNNPGRKY